MGDNPTPPTRLDEELRTHVTRAFKFDDPPETFRALWVNMMQTFSEGLERSVTVDDLCTTDDSPHQATVNGDIQYYQCVTDAFILGTFLDDPVTVRTESPVTAREIVVEFGSGSVVSVPDGAQLSFGVKRSVSTPDGPVTPEKMYERFCPYSKAFASSEEYEQWAQTHPDVVTDAHPLDESLALQSRLLGNSGRVDSESAQSHQSPEGGCSC